MLNILIIDDDPHVREALQAVLTHEGHHVFEAATASSGRPQLELKPTPCS